VNLSSFFAELKRRNVYKVAVAYAVVGWLLVQVATQVFPFFEIPSWAVRLIVLAIAIGFPIALVVAWAFELTPEGLKRTEDVDLAAQKRGKTHAWIYVVAVGVVLSIGLFFLGHYSTGNNAASRSAFEELRRDKQSEAATGSSIPQKSIAVLPFENLSGEPDNAYFTEGIQEEIRTRLAKIADLKVVSHTSTRRYKSSPENMREISKQLGVANVLEGSVQKIADKVRVNVQLIEAATDAHLWAESFDRKLIDMLQVESEIAKTIADTLQAKLTGSEQRALSSQPTANPEAYELYLKGRFFWNKRTAPDLKKAIDYFQQAIEKDPNYAAAYAGLADAWTLLPLFAVGAPKECFPKAEAAARKALELDETLVEAHTSLGLLLGVYHFDLERATAEFQRAIQLNPNYATAHHWFGSLHMVTGEIENAIADLERALDLDPLSLIINSDLGAAYAEARRFDEAIVQFRKVVEMDSGFHYAHWNLGRALEGKGATAEAAAEYKKTVELSDDPFPLALLGHLHGASGKKDEARRILDQLRESSKERYVSGYSFALVYLGLGENEKALGCLEESYRESDGYSIAYARMDPLFEPLADNPRFAKLVSLFSPLQKSQPAIPDPKP
jgi:TolB-like protein/tetratricopeptide (TPR) repeat protein